MMFVKIVFFTCLVAFSAAIVEDPKVTGRIVGGGDVALGQVPFMASLVSATIHFCGGTILNNRWIITSATCTMGRTPSSIIVRVGTVNLGGGVLHLVTYVIQHPLFDPATLANE